jgi:hypothetical protein
MMHSTECLLWRGGMVRWSFPKVFSSTTRKSENTYFFLFIMCFALKNGRVVEDCDSRSGPASIRRKSLTVALHELYS